jgi:hypothetical protein
VRALTVTLAPQAAAHAADDSNFNAEALRDAISAELKSRKLLDDQDPHADGTAEIVIDDLTLRPTSNAVLFGYQMLAGTLTGDVRVSGANAQGIADSRIVAESRLNISVAGNSKNSLAPLYRRFAVLTADHLAGNSSAGAPRN